MTSPNRPQQNDNDFIQRLNRLYSSKAPLDSKDSKARNRENFDWKTLKLISPICQGLGNANCSKTQNVSPFDFEKSQSKLLAKKK